MAQVLAPAPEAPDEAADADADADQLPYLADGVELIGKYEDSGFRAAPYLVKRGDGQVIQVSELIFLVAEGLDRSGDAREVAEQVSASFGREVSADNVRYLVENKLRPTGLLWSGEATGPAPTARANPLLALRLRLPLVPERIHRVVTSTLTPLFRPPVIVLALTLLLALDVWLVADLGSSVLVAAQALIYSPQLLLPITGLVILMGAFHETGHATAARYGGATPGAMGAGLYLVWPVFYTDVTDSYRLDRRGRLRTDLGGVYFNVLFMVAVGALYVATGHVLFLVFVLLAHVETLRQFLPFVRLDGYYIVSDLAGVPNLFAYMRPALARVTRLWRRGDHTPRTRPLEALTRRAQIVLVLWACLTAPILGINLTMVMLFLPQIAGAAWGSAGIQAGILADAVGSAQLLTAANAAVGIFFLLLPTAGMIYIAARMLRRVPAFVRRSWEKRPALTGAATAAIGLALVAHLSLVAPHQFSEAASEPARARAEAEASAAEARSRLARGVEALSDAVARVTPGRSAATNRARPAPAVPAPALDGDGPGTGDDSSGDGYDASDDADGDAGESVSDVPAAPPAPVSGPPATQPAPRPTPTTTAPADPPAGDADAPGETPEQTTTTQPGLPSLEELLSLLEPPAE